MCSPRAHTSENRAPNREKVRTAWAQSAPYTDCTMLMIIATWHISLFWHLPLDLFWLSKWPRHLIQTVFTFYSKTKEIVSMTLKGFEPTIPISRVQIPDYRSTETVVYVL